MNYNQYNTTVHIPEPGDELRLLNEGATVIARTDVVSKTLIWHHNTISANMAQHLTREHHERMINSNHSTLAMHYDSFIYRSIFHAMTAAIRNGSTLNHKLSDAYQATKRMDGFMEHLKTCALNPSRFLVGTCDYCRSGCYVEDMALISIGVPIVAEGQSNTHGKHGISINPICDRCAVGVEVSDYISQ